MSVVTHVETRSRNSRQAPNLAGIRILGTGMYAPSNVVRNEDLARLGYDSDWIIQRTGIAARCHATGGEATSDLAFKAARQCLERANVDPREVDLIILATVTPDHLTPSASCILQAKLGCQAPAMDLNAACSGFVYGLITASQFVKTGTCRNALVVGAEVLSNIVDPGDKKTFPIFGDGAGAVLIASDPEADPENPSGILSSRISADGTYWDKLFIPAGGSREPIGESTFEKRRHFLSMEGRCVFKWAVRLIPEVVQEMLDKSGLKKDDIDLFVFHQANLRILDAAVDSLGIDPAKVFINLDKYGNTSAASIPISLHEAVCQGRIKPGSTVLMAGFGGGLTWGSCVFRW